MWFARPLPSGKVGPWIGEYRTRIEDRNSISLSLAAGLFLPLDAEALPDFDVSPASLSSSLMMTVFLCVLGAEGLVGRRLPFKSLGREELGVVHALDIVELGDVLCVVVCHIVLIVFVASCVA